MQAPPSLSTASRPGASSAQLESSLTLLRQLLKLHLHLSLLFVFFCPFYVRPLLSLFLRRSSSWSRTSASSLLRLYLFLLPILGINGLLEAFVQAVASETQLGNMSYALLCSSGVYAAACAAGVRTAGMHEDALIWANAASMLARIAYAAKFVMSYASERKTRADLWRPVRDAKWTIAACAAVAPVMWWSERTMPWTTVYGLAMHLAAGLGCFVPCLAIR